jgi:hypothetical protein
MPVPATTGQLRTKIEDMQIGDYIACYNSRIPGINGIYSPNSIYGHLGENSYSTTEFPYSGYAYDGNIHGWFKFYFIKVDKGLLIADRVILNSISWNALNDQKVIQGFPWDSGNIIPTMTSNTSPSGVASASSEWNNGSVSFQAWKAFNGTNVDVHDKWMTADGITTGWLQYDFGAGNEKIIRRYSITSPNVNNSYTGTRSPKDWRLEASNDGISWTVIDQRSGQTSWSYNEKRSYMVQSPGLYRFYRLNVTANNGDATNLHIGEFQMMETAGIIRSLTGGVAYADANGNKSTTDLGYGAFPVNNEWDKYIVNFPQELIQSGKTLDDVFHWNGVGTWCQDTPINGVQHPNTSSDVGQNSERTWRGYGLFTGNSHINSRNEKMFGFSGSSYTATTLGFRPVFEYQE